LRKKFFERPKIDENFYRDQNIFNPIKIVLEEFPLPKEVLEIFESKMKIKSGKMKLIGLQIFPSFITQKRIRENFLFFFLFLISYYYIFERKKNIIF